MVTVQVPPSFFPAARPDEALALFETVSFAIAFFDPINAWTTQVTYAGLGPGLQIPLPNFTICSLNKVNLSRLSAEGGAMQGLLFVHELVEGGSITRLPEEISRLERWRPKFETMLGKDSSWDSMRRSMLGLGLSHCPSLIRRLDYRHNNRVQKLPVCSLIDTLVDRRGLCFGSVAGRYAQGGPGSESRAIPVDKPGIEMGPTLYLSPSADALEGSGDGAAGFLVFLNYGSHRLYANADPVLVAPGRQTFVALSGVEHSVQAPNSVYGPLGFGSPPRPCHGPDDPPLALLHGPYSSAACFEDCWYQATLALCNCSLPGPLREGVRVCGVWEFYLCVRRHSQGISREEDLITRPETEDSIRNRCEVKCQESCRERSVEVKVSTLGLETAQLEGLGNMSAREAATVSVLKFYFTSSLFKHIRQVPRLTMDVFISNVGGVSGVWCGASLLTVAQCLVFCVKWLAAVCRGLCPTRPGRTGERDGAGGAGGSGGRLPRLEWSQPSTPLPTLERPSPKGLRRL